MYAHSLTVKEVKVENCKLADSVFLVLRYFVSVN